MCLKKSFTRTHQMIADPSYCWFVQFLYLWTSQMHLCKCQNCKTFGSVSQSSSYSF